MLNTVDLKILDIGNETLRQYAISIRCRTTLPKRKFWQIFLPENKKHLPDEKTKECPTLIMPLGAISIDHFDLEITLNKKFKQDSTKNA